MTDLAAIGERDAALGEPFDETRYWTNADWRQHAAVALDDRRDLLALLRETQDALRRSTAMAHARGDVFFHIEANRRRGLDPDDWTQCDAPLCAKAVATLPKGTPA